MKFKLISIMAVWDEQNMIALSIESTKDIVYEYIVLIKKGTDKTKEVVEWCKNEWNLNIRIIETDIKLREARKLAVELTKDYADYYLIQDGDEIYFTEDELKKLDRETITDLMDQSYDHCESTIIYLYHDLLHTKIDNTWLNPHPFLIKNLPELFWPEHGDLPYLRYNWSSKKYKLYNTDIDYKWDNGKCEPELKEKRPFKFDCNIKNYARLFKRLVFTAWHDGNYDCSIETFRYNNDSRCEWYRKNIKAESNLDEIISFYEKNEKLNFIELYDESKYYIYPEIIKKYIKSGLIRGINDMKDIQNRNIRLFYYNSDKIGNFGDILSKYIVEKISKNKVVQYYHVDYKEFSKMNEPNLLSTGSIINFANTSSIIWGSGIIDGGWSTEWSINNIIKDNIRCVRGPLTASKLKEKIDVDVNYYGDPSLLLKELYNPKINKKIKLGIIPHINDYSFIRNKVEENSSVKIISLKIEEKDDLIEEKIKEILECDFIISSSLHGLIVPMTYNIPSMYFRRELDFYGNKISEDYHNQILTKYKDFFYSVYYNEYIPQVNVDWENFSLQSVLEVFNTYKYPTLISNRINDLINSYPFENIKNTIKIYYVTNLTFESTHVNYAILNSKYRKYINVIDYKDLDKLKFDKESIYFINCLSSSEMAKKFIEKKNNGLIKKLILHNSGNVDFLSIETLNNFDLIYYETLYTYKNSYMRQHSNTMRSFGINTEIFYNTNSEKVYDYIWVGSINDHLKKFSDIPKLVENKEYKILMVGDLSSKEDSDKILNLINQGYKIEVKPRCSLRELSYYYNISKCLLLTQPIYGGGERSLLEAKYCGLEIKILDNEKLSELYQEDIIFDIEYFSKQIDAGLDTIIND